MEPPWCQQGALGGGVLEAPLSTEAQIFSIAQSAFDHLQQVRQLVLHLTPRVTDAMVTPDWITVTYSMQSYP